MCVCVCVCSIPQLFQLFVTPWTVARQAPLSMGFPDKSTGVGCHFLLWGSSQSRDQTCASASPEMAGRFSTPEPPGMPQVISKA